MRGGFCWTKTTTPTSGAGSGPLMVRFGRPVVDSTMIHLFNTLGNRPLNAAHCNLVLPRMARRVHSDDNEDQVFGLSNLAEGLNDAIYGALPNGGLLDTSEQFRRITQGLDISPRGRFGQSHLFGSEAVVSLITYAYRDNAIIREKFRTVRETARHLLVHPGFITEIEEGMAKTGFAVLTGGLREPPPLVPNMYQEGWREGAGIDHDTPIVIAELINGALTFRLHEDVKSALHKKLVEGNDNAMIRQELFWTSSMCPAAFIPRGRPGPGPELEGEPLTGIGMNSLLLANALDQVLTEPAFAERAERARPLKAATLF